MVMVTKSVDVTIEKTIDVRVEVDVEDFDEDEMAEQLEKHGWKCFSPGAFDDYREDHGQQDTIRDIRKLLTKGKIEDALHLFDRTFNEVGDFH
jgi:hypothetical protein